jgi:CBS domain-containing protein
VIEARVRERRTHAAWLLEGHRDFAAERASVRSSKLTLALRQAQKDDTPIHTWPACRAIEVRTHATDLRVRAIMSTDLITIRPGDRLDLATNVMAWRAVRHVPVEDDAGTLLGMLDLRRWIAASASGATPEAVRDVMDTSPVRVDPEAPAQEALRLLLDHEVSALAVVENERLIGIVTERDLLTLSARILGV